MSLSDLEKKFIKDEENYQTYLKENHPVYYSSMKNIYNSLNKINSTKNNTQYIDKVMQNFNKEIDQLIDEEKIDEAIKLNKQSEKRIIEYNKKFELEKYKNILLECYNLDEEHLSKLNKRMNIDNSLIKKFKKDNFEKFGLYSKLKMWYSIKIHYILNKNVKIKYQDFTNGKDV